MAEKRKINYWDYITIPNVKKFYDDHKRPVTLPGLYWFALSGLNKGVHTLLTGLTPNITPIISTTGTGYFGPIPSPRRTYEYKGPVMTEKNLSNDVLDEMRRQVKYAKGLGYNFWSDHGSIKADGTKIPSMQKGLYNKDNPTYMQLSSRLLAPNPADMIETTFGHYNFKEDSNGDTIVEDVYDFDPSKGGFNALLAPFFGSVKDGDKNISWHINLGKIK